MTSDGRQDWRGGRIPRNSDRESEATPTWKQARHSPLGRSRSKGLWPKLRLGLMGGVLLFLVGAIIAFMWPARIHRTHFLVLSLLKDSQDFDSATTLTLPEGIETATSTRVATLCPSDSLTWPTTSKTDQLNLDNADTVVIYLQTTFVAGPKGEFQCLIRNSTPNLENPNEYTELGKLKLELDALWKKDSEKYVLLLVDSPPTSFEWRAGSLHISLTDTFEQWTNASPQLVVLMGSPVNGTSELGTPDTDGKTIFGHFASIGLSSLANLNSDQELTVGEYCSYVAERTNRWVQDHRDVAGQAVTVLPPLESLSKAKRNFKLITDLVPLDVSREQISGKSNADWSEIEKLWSLRQSLQTCGGIRWNPLLWKSATDKLLRAESATLHGQGDFARRALKEATETLHELEMRTNEICPQSDSMLVDRGIALSEFSGLPSLNRIRPLFPTEEANTGGTVEHASAEDVIDSQLRGFPFSSMGLTAPTDMDSIRSRRAAAETAVAQLLGCSDQLAQTMKHMEASLLLSEDRHFTRPGSVEPGALDDANPDALINAVTAFSEVRDRAETTLFEVLDIAPSLALWAAESGSGMSDADRKIWQKVLSQNSPETDVGSGSLSSMFDPLKAIGSEEGNDIADYQRTARDLQAKIYQLLVYGRALQHSLMLKEPDQGFHADELRAVTQTLDSAQGNASQSQRKTMELIEKMCAEVLGEGSDKRYGQVRAYHFLRSTLKLTAIKAETRSLVLRALQKLDGKLSKSDPVADAAAAQDKNIALMQPIAADEALWMLQILNFLPSSEKPSTLLRDAWHAANSLDVSASAEKHDAAARFGEAIRGLWKQNQDTVESALQDTTSDAHRLLRSADQRARLFSGFDARRKSLQSLTERLRQLNRIQYCLMHVDRLLSGHWVEPQDSAPFIQNGWYAKAAQSWLTAADDSLQRLSNDALGAPAILVDSIRLLKTRLSQSEQMMPVFETKQPDLNLSEQSKDSGTIKGMVRMNGLADMSGEAAVLVRLDPNIPFVVENNSLGLPIGGEAKEAVFALKRNGNPGTDGCQSVWLRPEIFFRGRFEKSPHQISVNPCAPTEFVMDKTARPQTASVTVSGVDPRPIVLILDYSVSMLEPMANGTNRPRFMEALATLKRLINDEALQDSSVILTVYGHRTKLIDGAHVPNPDYAKCFPDKVVPPGLKAHDDIETEFKKTISGPDDRIEFMKILDNLRCSQPSGTTPLTKALADAVRVTLKGKQGIVIAVTDGEATDMDETRKSLLAEALNDNPGTSVGIVAFDLGAPGQLLRLKNAFREFDTITIDDAAEQEQLLTRIHESLDPRKFSITCPSEKKLREAELGQEIGDLPLALDYSVQFDQLSSSRPIVLNYGDFLKLDIDRSARRFVFQREKSPVSKDAIHGALADDTPSLLRSIVLPKVSVLPPGRNSEMAMARAELSLMLDHLRVDLPVRQPAEIEFAVRSSNLESDFRPPLIHQVFTSTAGAPGWNLTIDEWPKAQRFLVDAIWKMERTPPEYVVPWNELKSAISIDAAVPVRVNGLPELGVWVTLRGNELQVRLDPVEIVPQPDRPRPCLGDELALNRVEDVRIEIGKKDTSDQNNTFQPWEINTRVVRMDSGSVRYEFTGDQISPENLAEAQIALTSAAARKNGAIEVRDLRID